MIYFNKKIILYVHLFLFIYFLAARLGYTQNQSLWQMERNRLKNFNFNLNIPSARSLGMGGAFLAVADDASAGETNPAGLTGLVVPEISAHFRYNKMHHDELNKDLIPKSTQHTFMDQLFSMSYLSIVIPGNEIKPSSDLQASLLDRLTFSFYRYELINFKRTFYYEPISFNNTNIDGVIFNSHLLVTNWGSAIGILGPLNLQFGLSLKYSELDQKLYEEIFSDENSPSRQKGNLPQNLAMITQTDYMANAFSPAAGIKWSSNKMKFIPKASFSVGFVYKKNPEFNVPFSIYTPLRQLTDNNYRHAFSYQTSNSTKVPDSYGIGFAFNYSYKGKNSSKITETLLMALDIIKIRYLQLLNNLPFKSEYEQFKIDEWPQVHFGCQILSSRILKKYDVMFRFGFYTEPFHQIYTNSDDNAINAQFPKGDNQSHVTSGLGFTNKKSFTLNLAYSHSEAIREWLFSLVFYLGTL